MIRAALALLLASARPPLDAAVLARLLGLDAPATAPVMAEAPDWPAQVLGTMVSPSPRFSLAAVFYLPGRCVVTLSVGERLGGAEVVEISRRSITLRTADGLWRVGVNARVPPPPPLPSGPPHGLVSAEREIRRDALLDLNRLSTGARAVPAFVNGELAGIRLFMIAPGSVYDQAGLRAGDIIQRINGHRLESPDAAMEAYAELQTSDWVEAEIRRGDSVLVLRYRIR